MDVWLRIIFSTILMTFLSGCVVVTENPAGEVVFRSKGKGWAGNWVGSSEVYYIDASNSLEGEIEIFAVSGNNKNNFELRSTTALLRKGSGKTFLNVKASEVLPNGSKAKIEDYWFSFVIEHEDDTIRLYIPSFEEFTQKMVAGESTGFVEVGTHQVLKGTSEEIADVYANDLTLALFDELNRLPDRLASIGVKETTNIEKYEELIAETEGSVMRYFPKNIDDSARFRLSHQPKFLQGGGHFHLEEQMTLEGVAELYGRMMKEALAYKDTGKAGIISLKAEVDVDTPGISYHTSDTEYRLPKGFRIFYTHAKPYRDDGFKWNHGSIAGIAINKDDGRAIYFVASW